MSRSTISPSRATAASPRLELVTLTPMAGVYRGLLSLLLVSGVVAAWATVAQAKRPPRPPQTEPAIAQYVETFPASGGPTVATTTHQKVATSVAKTIKRTGGRDANKLIGILRSPVYGGPQRAPDRMAPPDPLTHRSGGSLASVVTTGPGGTAGFWLLLLAATALPIAIRIGSRSGHGRSSW
jgi:hypothetical protein